MTDMINLIWQEEKRKDTRFVVCMFTLMEYYDLAHTLYDACKHSLLVK